MEKSYKKLLDDIAHDKTSGAAEIARKCLLCYKAFANENPSYTQEELLKLSQALIQSQPDMAPPSSIAKKMHTNDSVIEMANHLLKELNHFQKSINHFCFPLIKENSTLLTHSRSSTVVNMLESAYQKGKRFHLLVTESQPGGEGIQLANSLALPATLIKDDEVVQEIKKSDAVFVGADCITTDGFINKIGTKKIALLAKKEKVPFYVVADSFKFIDEKEPTSDLFEKTPLSLTSGIVTDQGIKRSPNSKS